MAMSMFLLTVSLISSAIIYRLASLGALVIKPNASMTVDLIGPGDFCNQSLCSNKNI